MTRLLSDSFTEGADKLLSAHAPETGGGWVLYSSSTMTVLAGEGRVRGADAASGSLYYNNATSAANVSVAATVRRTTAALNEGNPGLVARLQTAASNRYLAVHSGGQLSLQKQLSGSGTTLGTSAVSFPVDTDCTMELRINGTDLQVLWNGAVAIAVSDGSIAGAGYVGIAARLNGRLDTVTVDTIAYALAPAKARLAGDSDAAAVGVGYALAPAKARQASDADAAAVGVTYALAPAAGRGASGSDAAALAVGYAIAPADGFGAAASGAAAVAWTAPLAPSRGLIAVRDPGARVRRALSPPAPGAGLRMAVAADGRRLAVFRDLRTTEVGHG